MITKTYNFPSINFRRFWGYPCNTKNCDVEVTITLQTNKNGHLEFHINTRIWNPKHEKTFIDGDGLEVLQNFPEIATNQTYEILLYLYEKYQHREIHWGSPEQETLLHAGIAAGDLPPREEMCGNAYIQYLVDRNMYTVSYNNETYNYGNGWLNGEPIPHNDTEMMILVSSK